MRIDIILGNPEYCDNCPCLNNDNETGSDCNLGYDAGNNHYKLFGKYEWHYIRPVKCLIERGA